MHFPQCFSYLPVKMPYAIYYMCMETDLVKNIHLYASLCIFLFGKAYKIRLRLRCASYLAHSLVICLECYHFILPLTSQEPRAAKQQGSIQKKSMPHEESAVFLSFVSSFHLFTTTIAVHEECRQGVEKNVF